MADCSDLQARKREIEDKLAAAKKLRRSIEGEEAVKAAAEEASTSADYRSFKMIDGTTVNVNMKQWYAKAEADNLAMGEDALKEYVLNNIAINKKPNGSKGENINYSQLDPNEETLNSLLVLAGQDRQGTKFGQELAMPFTDEVASSALADQIALQGGKLFWPSLHRFAQTHRPTAQHAQVLPCVAEAGQTLPSRQRHLPANRRNTPCCQASSFC